MALTSDIQRVKSSSAISFDSVSKRYYKDLPLIESISFVVNYGEIVGLAGPSGSGKSTILQMAAGLISPDSGKIMIDGIEISSKNSVRGSVISYVPQDDFLVESLSVFENVALALELHSKELDREKKVNGVLDTLGIGKLADRMIFEISAGERRRVAISRGLVTKPKILITDEPTSSLDIERTNELLKLFYEIVKESKMAVLIASHDVLELQPFANKLYVMKNYTLESN